MSHKPTARTELLVSELGLLAQQIDRDLLGAASLEARHEWRLLRWQWPSAEQIGAAALPISDDELAVMAGKVRRFKAILETLGSCARARVPAPAQMFALAA